MVTRSILFLHLGFRNYLKYAFLLVLLTGCQHGRQKSAGNAGGGVTMSKEPQKLEIPGFTGKRAPKVGLILGPGGAKTFAHVGVLQEMESHKIPVVAVAGLEWGALAGGLFALNGEVHEVDWKLSQIPKMNFSSKNFFSRKRKSLATKEFDSYLNKIFAGARIQKMKMKKTK